MRIKLILIILITLSILITPVSVNASIISILQDGNIVINVLPAEVEKDEFGNISVQKIEGVKTQYNDKIILDSALGKKTLILTGEGGEKSMDLDNLTGEIVSFEERSNAKNLSIAIDGNQFVLKDAGVDVYTDFGLGIDPKEAKIFIKTSTGSKYISVLPKDAVNTLIRSKVVDRLNYDSKITLKEEGEKILYAIEGEKIINFFNVYYYKVPIQSKISAVDGKILGSNEPLWIKVVSIFLS